MRSTYHSSIKFLCSLIVLSSGVVGIDKISRAIVASTTQDFHVPGTQIGDVAVKNYYSPSYCIDCHADTGKNNAPGPSWSGSLMAHAGRDPLFLAQMAVANQSAPGAGYYCQRCHVPLSIPSGHADITDGSALDSQDLVGVSCHFCHSMLDPIYKKGISPARDLNILINLQDRPQTYGNAQFVLDPSGMRRAPRQDSQAPHQVAYSPFHRTSEMCGTCHDVGNPVVSKLDDGTFQYNQLNQASPDSNPLHQFPLERTYSEWKLSAFAEQGVNMKGRFGGRDATIIRTCQDCHMPRSVGRAASMGPQRKDLASHEFAGAAVQVLDLIAADTVNNASVDQTAIARGRAASLSMLEKAASLKLSQVGRRLKVRVINQTGHKLPTGHAEGRRVWLNVRFVDRQGQLIAEFGHYDHKTASLDTKSTVVYETELGLNQQAANATGLSPGGKPALMSLANKIFKDNRIPPRGYSNATYSKAGAGTIGWTYRDGQYWDDSMWKIPSRSYRVFVTLFYQSTPREYIEALRESDASSGAGQHLYELWEQTGRGSPVAMSEATLKMKCLNDCGSLGPDLAGAE